MLAHPALEGLTYHVKTFGCQMNLHDSERVSGVLGACGCVEVGTPEEADIVVYMTCCVREKADTHLYGQVSAMVSAPKPPSGRRIVAVGGCIAQRDGGDIREHMPNVDVVFGTRAVGSLPELIEDALRGNGTLATDTSEDDPRFSADLPSRREASWHAWVPIMTGCNDFCSYCIVPYVRGRERDRRFAVGETGIERIRFTSSHPKDLSDETIAAMAETDAVMPQLHLAVQSGSTKVLKAMNRHYTREDFISLAGMIKDANPGIALSTDIIVGFPGETEEDFEQTLSLVREVDFASAFTFIYSKRPGTPAAKIDDPTPREVIQGRFDRLAELVADLAYEANQIELGATVEALVEGPSKRNPNVLVGHSPKNKTVLFDVPDGREASELVGKLVDVRADEAKTWYLRGPMVGEPR